MKRKYLAITVYVLFLIILFEGSARVALTYLQKTGKLWEHDLGWKQSWVARHKSSGREVFYSFDIYDSTKGWISKPGLRNVPVFKNKILNTNSRGFRGTREYVYGKQDGITRILVLGDSFTFGEEVSDHEIYTHYLQELLPDAEIINLGVHGYGHDQMLVLLQEVGAKYEPDIVILGFLPADMSRNMLGFRDFAKPVFVLDDELVLKGVPVPTPEEVIKWDWLRPRIVDVFSVLHHMARMKLGLYEREMDQKTAALLEKVASTAVGVGAVPILVFLPAGDDISADPGLKPGEEYLFSVCENISVAECFSVRPMFADRVAQGETLEVIDHWNPVGHRIVAEAIRDYLVSAGHVPGQTGSIEGPLVE